MYITFAGNYLYFYFEPMHYGRKAFSSSCDTSNYVQIVLDKCVLRNRTLSLMSNIY